ncbi:retrovirus-related pol polyprotein from transposon TNT 1-94 [Tanacetum coccineum]
MLTSNTHQQSLANAGSETRPPMLERGSYIPWNFTPSKTEALGMQKEEDLRGDDLKHYEAEIEAMNLILISIPYDIYNSVDACTTTKAIWQRVKSLMRGTVEALVSVYNHFAQPMNDLERNGIIFPKVTINTKFLHCLQPEWLKYVTQVCLAKRLTEDSYDDLFDYLQQFEKLINASKKMEKSHDPLALVAHMGSSSRITTPYYVTHPSLVVDYDDDYQGDAIQNNSKDPLTSTMILLDSAITQRFSNPTNNHLRTSSNTINQAFAQEEIIEGNNVQNAAGNIQRTLRTASSRTTANVQCYNCSEKGHYARTSWNKYVGPSYDYAFLSEVQTPSISYMNPLFAKDNEEQKYLKQPKIINNIIGDDQIDSNIMFDEPNDDVNSSSVEDDNNAQQSYELEQLARNAYKEAEK